MWLVSMIKVSINDKQVRKQRNLSDELFELDDRSLSPELVLNTAAHQPDAIPELVYSLSESSHCVRVGCTR